MRALHAVLLVAVLCVQFLALPVLADEQKSILITGASTGIGRNMAETLASEGYFVYAGARKDADLAELDAIDNVKGVRLDVTKQDQVDAAVSLVKSEGRGLWALVNNAGVATRAPVAEVADDELDFVFGVNVTGVVRVTRAFIPMIVASKGRIVTTGSIAGIRSSAGGSVYSMSKHAVEAFTDSLAAEMTDAGVQVSIIEPGAYKSRIRRSTIARMTGDIEAAGGEVTEAMREQAKQLAAREVALDEPDDVSAALLHAVSADVALRRYMVTPNAGQAERTVRALVRELVELNEWEQNGFSRDELVEMLDETIAR
ncbi:MAG: SDR family NAD(P)-dependent oxidoreductase [Gammaproteobacteria bacterium]|nr:SDR family NAD(P)-dependent oxidoreductase [Gammaproteobacteria bacterium]